VSAPLVLGDIADLRAYGREREAFRAEVIALKRLRRVAIGPLVTVVLENRTTVRFQIQEMARAEKMVTDEQIEGELAVYNPLIPAPGELSMTMFIELTSETELREWLPRLVGVERSVLVRVGDGDDEHVEGALLDPDHERQLTRDNVTASVHYVRVVLPEALRAGLVEHRVRLEIDHPEYRHATELGRETKASIAADWA